MFQELKGYDAETRTSDMDVKHFRIEITQMKDGIFTSQIIY